VELLAEVVFDRPQDDRYRTTGLRFADLSPDVTARILTFLKGQEVE
jgi:hypothetical protein